MSNDKKIFSINMPTPAVSLTTSSEISTSYGLAMAPCLPEIPHELLVPCSGKLSDSKLIILKYEIEMYLIAHWTSLWLPKGHLQNAFVESAVVHARNLCDFFCYPKKDKYLRLADVVRDVNQNPFPTLIKKLKQSYLGKGKVRPQQAFNEFVAHMTKSREEHARGYNYDAEFNAIDADLKRIIEEIKPRFMTTIV
jgi:hypothetical protein